MTSLYIEIKEDLTQRRKGAKEMREPDWLAVFFAPLRLCVR